MRLQSASVRKRRRSIHVEQHAELLENRALLTFSVAYQISSEWNSGYQAEVTIHNESNQPVQDWELEFDYPHSINNIWNASIAQHSGDHYKIVAPSWASTIPANGSVSFGYIGSRNGGVSEPTNYLLNGEGSGPALPSVSIQDASVVEGDENSVIASFAVILSDPAAGNLSVDFATSAGSALAGDDFLTAIGTLNFAAGETQKSVNVTVIGDTIDESNETFSVQLSSAVGATIDDGRATGTITDNDSAVVPSISITDAQVTEGDITSAGFLSTSGNQIVDSAGNRVRITGVSWFGMETHNFAPHGLWTRNWQDMMDQIKDTGFNTIRLPYSNALFDSGSTPNSIDAAQNPDLQGLNGLQIMDKIVEYAGEIGLRIMLDHHRSDAGAGPNGNGLWYEGRFSEQRMIDDWVMLAQRYAGNSAVIGGDIHNEPHNSATWGSGDLAADWRLAAERIGNAILAVNSDWLIFVEGIQHYDGESYWWGGNLQGALEHPVRLDVAERLVYSPHAYPASVFHQDWFDDPQFPNNQPAIWDAKFGDLFRSNTAPVLLGEFGSKFENPLDEPWMDTMLSYLSGDFDANGTNDLAVGDLGMSYTWWSWNPNSGDTGGILADDWTTVIQSKVDKLQPHMFDSLGDAGGGRTVNVTVSLSAATTQHVTVQFNTADGTAVVDGDYVATSGTLTFAPGETSKTISLTIVGDDIAEATESFLVQLSNASGASIQDAQAEVTIIDDDEDAPPPPPLPEVNINDVSIAEGDAGMTSATFTVTLSAASTETATINYNSSGITASADSDFIESGGTIEFAPGETAASISIDVYGDALVEDDETFQVTLSGPSGATIADGVGIGTIENDDAPPPPVPDILINDVTVTEGDTGTTTATFTVTLSEATTEVVSVNYSTSDITATTGQDYQSASGTVTFNPGETSKQVTVTVLGDETEEDDETFRVNLAAAVGGTIIDSYGVGTITDDDHPANCDVTAEFFVDADWGSGYTGRIVISNNGTTVIDGWTLGFDFTHGIGGIWNAQLLSSGNNHFEVGPASWNGQIWPGSEVSFGWNGSPGNVVNGATNFTLNGESLCDDDDPPPPPPPPTPTPDISINDVTINEGNSGTAQALLTVTMTEATTETVTVNFATSNVSATAGSDYQATSGTLTFAAGETQKSIAVTINGDTDVEANETFNVVLSGVVGSAVLVDGLGVTTILNDDSSDPPDPPQPSEKRIVGYFTSWGVYGRDYHVSDIPANKLTHINYAFANIVNGEIALGDPYADIDKFYPGDSWDAGALRGNFNQLNKLKEQHPHLRTLISVGGWTWSDHFSDVALTDASREKFVSSAVTSMQQYGFDGIDIDWEYPVGGGEAGNGNRPEDRHNYTLLMGEFREQLDALESQTGDDYLLTIAVGTGPSHIDDLELPQLAQHLDWINVMSYDMSGAWSSQTGFNSPLYAATGDPQGSQLNVHASLSRFVNAGVPSDKIVMGGAFYGRGWQGVPNVNNGLFQSHAGVPAGTWEPGNFDYEDIKDNYLLNSTRYWHEEAHVPWLYNANTGVMITYDDPESLGIKSQYIVDNHYGGMMFWELSGDDSQASLLTSIYDTFNPATAAGFMAPDAESTGFAFAPTLTTSADESVVTLTQSTFDSEASATLTPARQPVARPRRESGRTRVTRASINANAHVGQSTGIDLRSTDAEPSDLELLGVDQVFELLLELD